MKTISPRASVNDKIVFNLCCSFFCVFSLYLLRYKTCFVKNVHDIVVYMVVFKFLLYLMRSWNYRCSIYRPIWKEGLMEKSYNYLKLTLWCYVNWIKHHYFFQIRLVKKSCCNIHMCYFVLFDFSKIRLFLRGQQLKVVIVTALVLEKHNKSLFMNSIYFFLFPFTWSFILTWRVTELRNSNSPYSTCMENASHSMVYEEWGWWMGW